LNAGRIAIGAQMVGIAQGALETTYPILQERKQFGKALYDFQAVRLAFSELRARTLATEALVYQAADKYQKGEEFLEDACASKLLASRLAHDVTSKCIDLVGGIGFTEDLLLAKLFRDCKIGSIYEGTDHMQLETIAKSRFMD
jgi:alkylation response protein AidB-like acyl-CoA dehydrogenase